MTKILHIRPVTKIFSGCRGKTRRARDVGILRGRKGHAPHWCVVNVRSALQIDATQGRVGRNGGSGGSGSSPPLFRTQAVACASCCTALRCCTMWYVGGRSGRHARRRAPRRAGKNRARATYRPPKSWPRSGSSFHPPDRRPSMAGHASTHSSTAAEDAGFHAPGSQEWNGDGEHMHCSRGGVCAHGSRKTRRA